MTTVERISRQFSVGPSPSCTTRSRTIAGLGADVTRFITEGEPISQLMP